MIAKSDRNMKEKLIKIKTSRSGNGPKKWEKSQI